MPAAFFVSMQPETILGVVINSCFHEFYATDIVPELDTRSTPAPPTTLNAATPIMDEAENSSRARRASWFFWLAAILVVPLDQIAKMWIRSTLPLGAELPVWPGWLHFTHALNHGAAWGVLSGRRWLLIIVTIAVIGFIAALAREVWARGRVAAAALGLILGGALGNMIDRIGRGAVTDFIDLDTPLRFLQTFPIFNIADAALTVGVALLIGQWLFEQLQAARAGEETS